MFGGLHILPYKDLIVHKAWADFKADSQRTYLGIAWWVLDPIINTFIFYLIFGVVMQNKTPNFVPFLLTGMVTWRWFDAATRGAFRSIYTNAGFVRQVSFPKIVFPLVTIMTSSYQFLFSLAVLFATLVLYQIPLTAHLALFPFILVVELMLIMAASLILGSVVPFIPDLATLFDYVFRILFYMSGIFYQVENLQSSTLKGILRLNPMVVIIESARDVLMYQRAPNWIGLTLIAAFSLAGVLIGASLISRFDLVYAKRIV